MPFRQVDMSSKLLNNELLEGVLKTIMVFDILDTKLSLSEIENHLIEAKANEIDLLEVLDFLFTSQIIIKVDNHYTLYNKQEDELNIFKNHQFSVYQKSILKIIELSGWVEGVFKMERPGDSPILIFKFYKEIHRLKKEKICKWATAMLQIRVFHAGIIPKEFRNELSATFLIGLKPILNTTALETFWNRNSWIFDYCYNSSMDYDSLLSNSRIKSRLEKKRNKISAFKSVGAFNISSYFKHLKGKTDFEEEYSNRLLYASQWIMPRVRHQIKRNQIV